MRSLIRTRTLAALCALLLMFASLASANIPSRPIDRPEGPPDPDPSAIGEPDLGHEIITVVYQGKVLVLRVPRTVWKAFEWAAHRRTVVFPTVRVKR